MRIISKYDGTCKICGQPYKVGDAIEWEPGVSGATHAVCPVQVNQAKLSGELDALEGQIKEFGKKIEHKKHVAMFFFGGHLVVGHPFRKGSC